MAKTEHFPDVAEARPHGNRAHMRRKLSPMAYVELGPDNGGILLNLSEGGFAVQSALALTCRELPELRFQVPAFQGWLKASGRIVWMSDSKKEAGIQFTELAGPARAEIQKWVLASDAPERANDRISAVPASPNEISVPPASAPSAPVTRSPAPVTRPWEEIRQGIPDRFRQQVSNSPYRGGEAARQPAVRNNAPVNDTQDVKEPEIRAGAPINATQQVREPASGSEGQTAVGAVMAEPPAGDFRFTDYSMFAPAPETEPWSQPTSHRGSWRRVAVGILVAALFFALGATVGRETVDRWIADLEGWTQNQLATAPAPKMTAPAPPEQGEAGSVDSKAEGSRGTKSSATAGEDQTTADRADNQRNQSSGPEASSGSGNAVEGARSDTQGAADRAASPKGGSAGEGGSVSSSARRIIAPGSSDVGSRQSAESEVARNGRGMEGEPGRTATDHAILVNAPEPGSRPFFVNLPSEAISASPAIAISARRSLEILPRSSAAASASQRVVIGKLISHSEPFYPAEARKRGVEGSVELRARIGRTGQVIGVSPISGPWLLFPAAVSAVREWRYEPTFVNGDPAETLADITIVFRLH